MLITRASGSCWLLRWPIDFKNKHWDRCHPAFATLKKGGTELAGRYFVFQNNIVQYDNSHNPQWLQDTTSVNSWPCSPENGDPCTGRFSFLSNDYWSPDGVIPTFMTYDTPNPQTWNFGTTTNHWQSTVDPKDPGEDRAAVGGLNSVNVSPGFVNPTSPADNYRFISSLPGAINFDAGQFLLTYTAGRNQPFTFPQAQSSVFPTVTLAPNDF